MTEPHLGPFMICSVCKTPLTVIRIVDSETGERVEDPSYEHPVYAPGDHEPQPVRAAPGEAALGEAALACDFCHAPDPRWVFVLRRKIEVDDPLDDRMTWDYSSPWSCCEGCLKAVKTKNISKMLDRAMNSPHGAARLMSTLERTTLRKQIRGLYSLYLASAPAGPYEAVPRPEPKPFGTRGGRKGM